VEVLGIESTGSYAAGLTRFLHERHLDVREINMPHRYVRSRVGKTDTIDAEAAARKVLSGAFTVLPKDTGGAVESIRYLSTARKTVVKSRTMALNQIHALLVTAPAPLREAITAQPTRGKIVRQCVALRPDDARLTEPLHAAKFALRALGPRVRDFDEEIAELDLQLGHLVRECAPTLVSKVGIGTHHAAQLLMTAGQNLDRLTNDAAFARLCGVAPIPASSVQTRRMRLHRGGDRQANRALYMIAVVRLRRDPRTKAYMERRTAEGLSKKDVIRCLKRFIAREVFYDLKQDLLKTRT
jgi:transposase